MLNLHDINAIFLFMPTGCARRHHAQGALACIRPAWSSQLRRLLSGPSREAADVSGRAVQAGIWVAPCGKQQQTG